MTSDRNENNPWKPCPMEDPLTFLPIRQSLGQPRPSDRRWTSGVCRPGEIRRSLGAMGYRATARPLSHP